MRPRSLEEAVAIIERSLIVIAEQQERISMLETRAAEQRAEIIALRAQVVALTQLRRRPSRCRAGVSSNVYRSPATSRPQAFRSVILIIATALLSLYACSFVSLLQVHT